ncbi:MAG TPA: hypothetical protein VLA78_13055 [Paracoccaceae bacterium]|nr:hypothetical protein [Paracoccaceae bacterium]
MFILTPDTITNRAVLEMRQVPRRIFGRVTIWPRRGAGWRLRLRLLFEMELLRYLASLLPFVLAALIWQDHALAISQAPLLMFMLVYLVETRFLRPSAEARKALVDPAEADRRLDLLRARARRILTRIAAGRGMTDGALHLVVEQSELARIMPLTLVSVQDEGGAGRDPHVLDLTAEEEALIRETLFAEPLTEAALHLVNLAQDECLRAERLDLRHVSAHARLAAMMG